ncbi:MAG: dipeptide epimerase [Candidatus Eisenbacteria bacterium]|nr:dipeptide epimerase [Candidatus Latescibacterota bacterium]MBD3301055.1 dipeptide epimerase [Candidatus Eisenbacteria bacterium]
MNPRIERFEAFGLPLALRAPFRTHWKDIRTHESVRVRIVCDGIEGNGEAYTLETAGALSGLREADLQGADPFAGETITRRIADPAARSAVDLALHDWIGRRFGLPVHRWLGLPRARATSCLSIGIDEPERMIADARRRIAGGAEILKVKLTTDTDLAVLAEIRRIGGNGLRIWVDANQAFDPEQAVAVAARLADLGVELFEQPLPVGTEEAYARIRPRIRLPIVLDESIRSAADAAAAARAGGIDGINVKLAKVGGIREALRAIAVARAHGLRIFLGCYFESSLGIAAAAQLLSLADWVDLDAPLFLAEDPYEGLAFEGTALAAPDRPGLGVRERGDRARRISRCRGS